YPHLSRRLLDPQMYLAGLNAAMCRKTCVNLASYGWFLREDLPTYDSTKQTLSQWTTRAQTAIHRAWPDRVPSAAADIEDVIRRCIDVQNEIGCEAVILPSPLTTDASSTYEGELLWL